MNRAYTHSGVIGRVALAHPRGVFGQHSLAQGALRHVLADVKCAFDAWVLRWGWIRDQLRVVVSAAS